MGKNRSPRIMVVLKKEILDDLTKQAKTEGRTISAMAARIIEQGLSPKNDQ